MFESTAKVFGKYLESTWKLLQKNWQGTGKELRKYSTNAWKVPGNCQKKYWNNSGQILRLTQESTWKVQGSYQDSTGKAPGIY